MRTKSVIRLKSKELSWFWGGKLVQTYLFGASWDLKIVKGLNRFKLKEAFSTMNWYCKSK
jgi:hypothetical protein